MTNQQINSEVAQQRKKEKYLMSLKPLKDSYEEVIDRIYEKINFIKEFGLSQNNAHSVFKEFADEVSKSFANQ